MTPNEVAEFIIFPQVGIESATPTPKKERLASDKI